MVSVCFYFQVHQPFRLRHYTVFDVGNKHNYFDEKKNDEIMKKVAKKCYIPTNTLMLKLLEEHPEFRISYSISGVALDQFEKYAPEVIDLFKKLAETGRVEFLTETYYHSLAYLYSKDEFKKQVEKHQKRIKDLFGVTPDVFRNTELIYNNEIANYVEGMGFKGILAEGVDNILGWRSPNFLYKPRTCEKIKLLLKNYRLSDDIAFRFSNQGWADFPLTAEKFADWVHSYNGSGNTVNLFMDYETFGEHQWEDTGIFNFLEKLPKEILKHPHNDFKTPSELIESYDIKDELDIHNPISWADLERDLSAWLGNKMQQSSIKELFLLEEMVMRTKDKELIEDWRKLTTSDHYYYMCTKFFADGDVHKYFNPYDSPYDAFISFMNVLNDVVLRAKILNGELIETKKDSGKTDDVKSIKDKVIKKEK